MSSQRLIRYDTADGQAGGEKNPFAKAVTGGLALQTEQVIANIKEVLALESCGMDDIVKVNCWLDDTRDFFPFNAGFRKHFSENPPARSTVESRLMVDAKVQTDVLAWKPL